MTSSLDLSGTLGDLLARAGLSRNEVARRLHLDAATVCDWANGRRAVPEHRHAALAEALGITVEQLTWAAPIAVPKRTVLIPSPERVGPKSRPEVHVLGERMEAYSFALAWGPSPVPGRPRALGVA